MEDLEIVNKVISSEDLSIYTHIKNESLHKVSHNICKEISPVLTA